MVFPQGIVYELKNRKFGTSEMSVLYRLVTTKKTSGEALNNHLVAGVGLEPTTLWL